MSDYKKLWKYLGESSQTVIKLTFEDINKIVGFEPKRMFIFDKLEAVNCGYEAIEYSYKNKYVVFRKIDQAKKDEEDTIMTMHTMGMF